MSGAYDQWHAALAVDEDASAPWHELVKKHLPPLVGARVLEIGCGRGGFARWLVERAPSRLVAADFSATAVGKAADFNRGSRARFAVADICRLPHPDSSFDVVISCETIEHVTRPTIAVGELARVLQPGGALFLTTPNYVNVLGLFRAYRRLAGRPFKEEGQPINNLTLIWRTMRWVRAAGLEPRLVDAQGHCLVVPGLNRPVPLRLLDGPLPLLKWLARHQLLVATKPSPSVAG